MEMYDTSKTQVSLGVLIELFEGLQQYRDSHVLAGGWAPYFITKGHFEHCGSLDIDLVLRPQIFKRYESIRDTLAAMNFEPTTSPFKFRREIAEDFDIELDLLSEPEALQDIPARFVSVQEDLNALIIPGSSLAFTFNFEAEAKGKLTDGSELSTKLKVADIVSTIGLKGHALGRPLKLEKDCYDVYAICGFTGGSPMASAEEFTRRLTATPTNRREREIMRLWPSPSSLCKVAPPLLLSNSRWMKVHPWLFEDNLQQALTCTLPLPQSQSPESSASSFTVRCSPISNLLRGFQPYFPSVVLYLTNSAFPAASTTFLRNEETAPSLSYSTIPS